MDQRLAELVRPIVWCHATDQVHDAARRIAIVTRDAGGNTPQRLHRGRAGLRTADEAQALSGAFEDMYALLMGHEADALRSGAALTTFIAPADLDTLKVPLRYLSHVVISPGHGRPRCRRLLVGDWSAHRDACAPIAAPATTTAQT